MMWASPMVRRGWYLFGLLMTVWWSSVRAEEVGVTGTMASEQFTNRLHQALETTGRLIQKISDEWDIPNYPKFLKSCFMHKSAWETMKWKYMWKILQREITKEKVTFVISFTGSSVTAGHDSHFNQSTPIIAGLYMKDAFDELGLTLDSRNVALGNNPCMPYDICIKYFAGFDADVVIWEQNYFCDGSPLMEQYIRQAMTIPTRPIVAFSESNTGHWHKDQCKKGPHRLSPEEKDLARSNLENVVSEMNKDVFHKTWGVVNNVAKHYHGAAIQTFQHATFEDYACLGPYIKSWMEGAASWHPSVIGHRVRAAHHAYFWLHILKEAIQEVIWSKRALDAFQKDISHHLEHNYKPLSDKVGFTTPFVDNMTCYTDYEPRAVREASLKKRVLSGLAANPNSPGWKYIIYENLVDKKLVERSRQHGYQDFKYLLYSDDNAGSLSVKLPINKEGPVFICETPGIWGSLPHGFMKMRESPLDIYITYDVSSYDGFVFDESKAVKQSFQHSQLLDICIQLKHDKNVNYKEGKHVLTLKLREKKKIIFAWLITP